MDTHRGLFLNGSRTPPQRSCVSRNLYRVWGTKRRSKVQPRIGQWRPMVWSGRDRIALPCGGSIPPPYLGGVPPHPKGEGSNPSEIYPCPNISSGNYDIFVIDCPGWGYPPPPGSQYPPFLGGGRGGSKPPPGAWDCYGGYPPKRGGVPPPPVWVPKWVPGGGGPMSPRTIGQNRGRHSGVPPVPRAIA